MAIGPSYCPLPTKAVRLVEWRMKMKVDKLFQVLVVGGGLLVAGVTTAPVHGFASEEPEVEATPVFCDADKEMCVTDVDGNVTVKDGFVCCWGTSCDKQ